MIARIAWFVVDGFIVADAEDGDYGDEDGDDEDEEERILDGMGSTWAKRRGA